MMETYDQIAYLCILAWVIFRLSKGFVPPRWRLAFPMLAALVVFAFAGTLNHVLVAVLAPFGTVLPILAVRDIANHSGLALRRFGSGEIIVFTGLYVGFLSASLGVFSFDPYRFGYDPVVGAGIAIAALGYTLWRKHYVLTFAILSGQLAWVFSFGSTNIFDHLTHVLLVPVAVMVLMKRLLFKDSGSRSQTS